MKSRPTKRAELRNRPARNQGDGAAPNEMARAAMAGVGLKPCDSRCQDHAPGRVAKYYGSDQSGTVEYKFNSCGYRSEEYRSDARFRICIIGESNAVGTGLHFEDTFGFKLKTMMARILCLDPDEVNLINLAIGGSSADYCARTVFRQLPQLTADLVVCVIPRKDRIEYQDGKFFKSLVVQSIDVNNLDKVRAELLAYCDYYDDDVGRLNRLKNMLLICSFLKSHSFEFVVAVEDMPHLSDGFRGINPFLAELDEDRVLQHQFFRQKADRSADGNHAGPRSHAAFAIMVLNQFGYLLRSRQQSDLSDLIETEALRLMSEDEDFAFCVGAS